jgi:RNA polymerase-binding transcription factor DksA
MSLREEQLRHLEARLREERERALDVIRRYDEGRSNPEDDGDLTNYPFHLADQGTDSFDQELSSQLADRATRELQEIEAALQRLYEASTGLGSAKRRERRFRSSGSTSFRGLVPRPPVSCTPAPRQRGPGLSGRGSGGYV